LPSSTAAANRQAIQLNADDEADRSDQFAGIAVQPGLRYQNQDNIVTRRKF
jgi:hypothetical protein